MRLSERNKIIIDVLRNAYDGQSVLSTKEIHDAVHSRTEYDGFSVNEGWFRVFKLESNKRGQYTLPFDEDVNKMDTVVTLDPVELNTPKPDVKKPDITLGFIPEVDKSYVRFGHFKDIEKIIKSKIFYPIFLTGLSGNGKTFSVEQVCAKLKREMVRVNVTVETDEDDLLGGFRLVNGQTEFHKGPVIEAMERGAVLLLDEVDLASNKILALQPVLEGKGVYLKKINEWVQPADGFNVIATANTKGKGSETGAFIGTNILNEAFLERFAITLEQDYPAPSTETKIVNNVFKSHNVNDHDFARRLVDWAGIIRKTFYDGGTDEIISTRRLVHVAKAFSIFENKLKAIELCIARFDEDTKATFRKLYECLDEDASVSIKVEEPKEEVDSQYEPF
mgnify:CR=1 FL=1|tara:strand:- start:410 stop:1585 length:1176 start_codon:yes stop_codon:yes gene_type:complete